MVSIIGRLLIAIGMDAKLAHQYGTFVILYILWFAWALLSDSVPLFPMESSDLVSDIKFGLMGAAIGWLSTPVLIALVYIFPSMKAKAEMLGPALAQLFEGYSYPRLLLYTAFAVLAEELVFRGAVHNEFGLVIGAVAFVTAHTFWNSGIWALGLIWSATVFGLLYDYTGNLNACFVMHFVNNTIVFSYLRYMYSAPSPPLEECKGYAQRARWKAQASLRMGVFDLKLRSREYLTLGVEDFPCCDEFWSCPDDLPVKFAIHRCSYEETTAELVDKLNGVRRRVYDCFDSIKNRPSNLNKEEVTLFFIESFSSIRNAEKIEQGLNDTLMSRLKAEQEVLDAWDEAC